MKPGESLHTGLHVWDKEGRVWKVKSVIIGAGKLRENNELDFEFKHTVVLVMGNDILMAKIEVPFDEFVKEYHHRRTGWEHVERLDLEEPVSWAGPIKGYHCIKTTTVTRIPDRVGQPDAAWAELQARRAEATRESSGFSEWYEWRASEAPSPKHRIREPEGAWALVLEPAL